jgi:hypothetical protein
MFREARSADQADATVTIPKGFNMKKASKKPKGWKAFDALARKLVQVPKAEVGQKGTKRRKKK